jgi:uncharacterized cupin superfamily protein/NifU-like protein involved in Fe-S cluster formation
MLANTTMRQTSARGDMRMINDIYNKKILALAADIPRLQRLNAPDATSVAHSKLCGSKVTVDLKMKDGVVTDFGHDVKACALGQASSSIMAAHVVGATAGELRNVRTAMYKMLKEEGAPPQGPWADCEALLPVRDYKARHASTLLTFDAVVDAISQIEGRNAIMSNSPSTVNQADVARKTTTGYPEPYRNQVQQRARAVLGNLFGLDQFGVNIVTLAPGAWSSHRHWHATEDEFVYVLEGEITLADDAGDHPMTAGMCAGFKAGRANGHHLKNLSSKPATYLEVGTRNKVDTSTYSDIDMLAVKDDGNWRFVKRDGSGF